MAASQCALGVDVNDDDAEEDQLESILLCRKYLLQAGCDPTLPVITYGSEPDCDHFQYFLVSAVPVCLFRRIVFHILQYSPR